jgi:spore coat protein A
MAWPRFDVEPRKYRLRLLNGSDSRFYVFEFRDDQFGGSPQSFYQIGTDNGLLPTPVPLTRLLLAPGERADVVVDFAGKNQIYLRNFGPDEPFKGLNPDGNNNDGMGGVVPPADPATTGQVMMFDVSLPLDPGVPDATVGLGTLLRPDIMPLQQTCATRQLVLFEGLDQYGRLQPLLGTLEDGSLAWFEPITENPMLDDTEVWEVYNATMDAHPIHLHLVSFQILSRESFSGTVIEKAQPQHMGGVGVGGVLTDVVLGGDARDPEANERGWKDTAVMLPGEVTRVIANFNREGRYVWHCHILSHEDHEMMREFYVGPMPVPPMPAMGPAAAGGVTLVQNAPNPFNPVTRIGFELGAVGAVDLRVYNVRGQEVRALADRSFPAGMHSVEWDGKDNLGNSVPSGVYFYQLRSGNVVERKKMVLLK